VADDVVLKITAQTDELKAELANVKGMLSGMKQGSQESLDSQRAATFALQLKGVADAAGAIGQKFSAVSGYFLDAANQADDMRKKLSSAFRPDEVEGLTQAVRELGATPPFSGDQFTQAAITLQKFGVEGLATAENLKRMGDIAAGTGGSLEGMSQIFGLLARGGDEAKRAVMSLSKEYGITGTQLQEFGAAVDETGKLLVGTPEQAEAARKALEAMADSKFAGAMDAQADGVDKLKGQIQLLAEDAGAPLKRFLDEAASGFADVLAQLRETNPALAEVAGTSVAVVGGLGSVTGSALETGAQVAMLTQGLKGSTVATKGMALATKAFSGAMTAALSPMGLALIAIGALAVGFAAYTAEIEKSTAAQESLLAIEERRAGALRKHKDYIGKSADELHRMRVKASELVDVIGGLQDQLEAARKTGNDEQVQRLEAQIRAMQKAKTGLAELEAKEKKADEERAKRKTGAVEQSDKAQKAQAREVAKSEAAAKAATDAAKKEADAKTAGAQRAAGRTAEVDRRSSAVAAQGRQRDAKQRERERERERKKAETERKQEAESEKKDAEKSGKEAAEAYVAGKESVEDAPARSEAQSPTERQSNIYGFEEFLERQNAWRDREMSSGSPSSTSSTIASRTTSSSSSPAASESASVSGMESRMDRLIELTAQLVRNTSGGGSRLADASYFSTSG